MELKYMVRLEKLRKVPRVHSIDGKIDFYALLILFSGNMEYVVNGKSYSLCGGDILFMPPGTQRSRQEISTPSEYFALNFFTDKEITLPLYMPDAITKSFTDIVKLYDKAYNDFFSAYTEDKTMHLLELILICLTEFSEKQIKNSNVDRILKYIDATFTQNITLSDIASCVDLTVPYCCALVKKELGCTIYDLVSKKRITLAQYYITETDLPLKEISLKCGFNSYNTFVKSFKNIQGITPNRYRKV